MNKLFLCCFPQKKEIIINSNEEEVEVKNNSTGNIDEKAENATSNKSRTDLTNINNTNAPTNNKSSSRIDNTNNANINNNQVSVDKRSNINDGRGNVSDLTNKNHSNCSLNQNLQNENNQQSNNFNSNSNSALNNLNNNQKNINNQVSQNQNVNNPSKKEDISIVEITNAARVISDEDIKNAPVLLIEEITGNILKNNKLTVNAAGLVGGMRKMRDGVAFFGKQLKHGDTIVNDFELNIDYPGNGLYTFIIYYKKENNKYYLRAYRDKQTSALSMLLIKLDDDYYLTRKEILSISDYFFQLTPLADKLEIHKLANKNSQNSEKFTFDNSQEVVTIGRDSKCNVFFNGDKAFSKIQTTFIYDKDLKVWRIKDGSQDKPSTNGTWIFAAHSYEINDKTVFRVGNSKLVINFQ